MSKLLEDLRKWFDSNHPEGGWKRINSKGEAVGPCAREPGEAKPKCMSNAKRAALSKKERAAAVRTKRKHDPNPERKGSPINVSNFGKGKLSEQMEQLDEKNKPTNPKLWSRAVSLARSKFDVYPSAYANGWAAKWYKSKGGGWETVSEGLGDAEKRRFKRKELEFELRHEVEPRRKSYSSPSTQKIYHKVPFNQREDAKKEGMRFDGAKKKWYHTDAQKSKQSKFQTESFDQKEILPTEYTVYSDVMGQGIILESAHSEPDDYGNIEWFTVRFEHGDEIVYAEDLKEMLREE